MTGGDAPTYWWCLDHQTVEPDEGCANSVRLGPFATQEDAAGALELARQRTEAWDKDQAWNDDPTGDT
jgi:hypothetical protein